MSWLGGSLSLSSIKGQISSGVSNISNLTKEVLSEVVAPLEDEDETEISKKVEELEQRLVQQELLTRQWEQRAVTAENQLSLNKVSSGQPSSSSCKDYEFPSGASSNNEESSQDNDGDFVNIPLAAASLDTHEDSDDLVTSSESRTQLRDRVWRKCRYLLAEVDLHLPPEWGPPLLTEKEQLAMAVDTSVPVSAAESTVSSLMKGNQHQVGALQVEMEKLRELVQTTTAERDNLMASLDELDQQHQLALQEALKGRSALQQQVHELEKQWKEALLRLEAGQNLQERLDHAVQELEQARQLVEESEAKFNHKLTEARQILAEELVQKENSWEAEKTELTQLLKASLTRVQQAEDEIGKLKQSVADSNQTYAKVLRQWEEERRTIWALLRGEEEHGTRFDVSNTDWLRLISESCHYVRNRVAELEVQLNENVHEREELENECSEAKEKLETLLSDVATRSLVPLVSKSELEPIVEEFEEIDVAPARIGPQKLLLEALSGVKAPPLIGEGDSLQTHSIMELEQKIETLEAQLWDKERQIKRKQEAVDALRNDLNQVRGMLAEVDSKLRSVEGTSLNLACSLAALSKKEKSQEDLIHQLAEKECVIHELELKLLTAGSQSVDSSGNVKKLEKINAELREELENLQVSKQQAENQLSAWQNRHAELIEQIEAGNKAQASIQYEYHSLREELAMKDKRCSELEQESQRMTLTESQTLQNLQRELADLHDKWQTSENLLKTQDDSNDKLQNLVADKTEEIQLLNRELAELGEKLSILQGAKEDLQQALAQSQEYRAELVERLGALDVANTTLTAEREKLKNELGQMQQECADLRSMMETLSQATADNETLHQRESELNDLRQKLQASELKMREELVNAVKESETFLEKVKSMEAELVQKQAEVEEVKTNLKTATEALGLLRQEKEELVTSLQAFQTDREQLVTAVQQKHQESLTYHAELQRVMSVLQDKEQDGETVAALQEQLTKAQDKCEALQQHSVMLENERSKTEAELAEVRAQLQWAKDEAESNGSKTQRLETEVSRLTEHLVSVEDSYTQEALKAEQRAAELKQKLEKAEDQLRKRQTALNSASQRAVLQADSLQEQVHQLKLKIAEEELFRKKAQEDARQNLQSLTNLQLVLEQFQKEKERELDAVALEWKRKLGVVEAREEHLKQVLSALKTKFSEAQIGLEAAARLTQQFDVKSAQLAALKDEVKQKESEIARMRKEKEDMNANQGGKVDRFLVKNLIVGYFMAPPAKRSEVLRIIATVLDFSAEERAKTGVDASTVSGIGWGTALLRGAANRIRQTSQASENTAETVEKSLSEAFIRFLQAESQPQVTPKLPAEQMASDALHKEVQSSSDGHSTPQPMAAALPTMEMELTPSRNAPTILRDVLQDRSK